MKDFSRVEERNRPNYSSYGLNWTFRIRTSNELFAEESLTFNTAEKRSKFESLHGVQYSVLLYGLHYSDTVSMHGTDPLHNVMLDFAKHLLNT